MPRVDEIIAVDSTGVTRAFAVLGFFIVIYGQVSYIVKERLYLSEPLIAVTLGILVGPYVLGWVDPLSWSNDQNNLDLMYNFTRLVVGVQVLFTGIALPKAYLRREAISLLMLLGFVMTIAWFVTALLIWGLIRMPASVSPDGIGWSLTFLESLCIAAAVTPTDPVLANSITKGRYAEKHVPANVRNIILAESGANDGLGFPFLYLAIYLLDRNGIDKGESIGSEVGQWVYAVLIYQILLSCVYGAILGYIARKSLKWAEARNYIDKDSFFAFGLGLALFTLGTCGLFGSDDILACFVAGNSFTWDDWFRLRSEESDVQDILDMLLNAAVFIYIGSIIQWDYYHTAADMTGVTGGGIETWRIVLLGIFVLLLRRPPWVIGLTKAIPALSTWGEGAFAGWFGPIGVGAVFYIAVALREIPDDGTRDRLRLLYTPVVLFCIFSSILTHGVTIPLSKLGPSIVRRTNDFSRTRSITFTKPSSRADTLTQSGTQIQSQNKGGEGKELWNPLHALALGILSVVLFWRKDSFWRSDAHVKDVRVENIGNPTNPTRSRQMEAENSTEVDTGESSTGSEPSSGTENTSDEPGPRGHRPPPPAQELPLTNTATAASNPGTSGSSPAMPAATFQPASSSKAHAEHHQLSTLLADARDALEREMNRERSEARQEVDEPLPKQLHTTIAQFQAAQQEVAAKSGEGSGTSTPNKVRFN